MLLSKYGLKHMNETSVQILPATASDLPAISQLARIIWWRHYPGIISEAQIEFMLGWMYSLETLREELLDRGIRFERLLLEDDLVGFAAYGPIEEKGAFKLHKLYVHPDQQGRGLGTRLLVYCEQAAASLGAERLILAVNKRNQRAIHTYKKNGYAILDSVVIDIGSGFVMDDFVMVKPLQGIPMESN